MGKKNVKRQGERTVKYAYLRDERDPRRVMTVARRWGKNGNKMHYAYAICNPTEDQFRKEIGRAEAGRRLEASPAKIRPLQGEFILRGIIEDLAYNAKEDRERNARSMANQWLDENDRRMEEDYLLMCEEQEAEAEESPCLGDCAGCSCEATVELAEVDEELDEEEPVVAPGKRTRAKKSRKETRVTGGCTLAYSNTQDDDR